MVAPLSFALTVVVELGDEGNVPNRSFLMDGSLQRAIIDRVRFWLVRLCANMPLL